MASELISIGEDGTGDKLCNEEVDNSVYIWYHETGEIEELASNQKEFIILQSEELDGD
ncbi:hypothetical protein SAMN05443252_109103 [Bacillus sp. OV322]|nr:hypothetical protein SAMN05443252_109103 [Bacillus sp. OV322]